jgi:hypothetical protein
MSSAISSEITAITTNSSISVKPALPGDIRPLLGFLSSDRLDSLDWRMIKPLPFGNRRETS